MGAAVRRQMPDFCEWPECDWPYEVQRHHITPKRNGGGGAKKGNLISLCPNHHASADRGRLDPDDLRAIVAARSSL